MERTTTAPIREWVRQAVDLVDRLIFFEPDLDAVRRGWEVGRPRPFARTYRDPRWAGRTSSTAETASSIGGSP